MNATASATDQVRMVSLVSLEIREALNLEAAKRGANLGDIISEWTAAHAAQSLTDVRRRLAGRLSRKP